MISKLTRLTRYLTLLSLIFIAFVLTVIRLFVFCIDVYKHELELKLSELVDAPVSIKHLSAKMYRLHPEIILNDIFLSTPENKQAISLKELHIGVDLVEWVLTGQLLAATQVSLIGAKLSVIRQHDGSFSLLGLKAGEGQPLWLLQGKQYQLLQSEITWLDKKRHGKKVTFKHVDLIIKNEGAQRRHQIHFLSQLPSVYGKKLRASVEIQGNLFEPDNLSGRLFIEGDNIQFSKLLTGELPLKLTLNRGQGDFKLWGKIQHSELNALTGYIDAKKVSFQRQDKKKIKFSRVKTRFNWANQMDHWRLAVENLQTTQKKGIRSTFSLGANHKQQVAATITKIDLQLLSRLSQFFMPLITDKPIFKKRLLLSGVLSKGRLFADLKQQRYALNADFKQLAIQGMTGMPNLSNLSGSIQGSDEGGKLTFTSQNVKVRSKKLVRKPLKIKQLTGIVHWQQFCDHWRLNTPLLRLKTPHLRTESQFTLTIPKTKQANFIDLHTAFYDIKDVSQLKHYFPVGKMSKETLAWLDRAFVSGAIKQGGILFHGHLDAFPFKKHEGVFQVLFKTHQLELAYAEKWPNLKAINAEVMFLNEGLEVTINHAQSRNVTVNKTVAKIPSLKDSAYLSVDLTAKSRTLEALNWLQKTPLKLPIDEILEQLTIKGNSDIGVHLKIPLMDQGGDQLKGQVKFSQSSLIVRAIDLPLTHFKGTINFDEKHFYSNDLQAVAIESPIKIKIKDTPQAVKLNINGEVGVKALQRQFKLADLKFAEGKATYQLELSLPAAKNRNTKLHLRSNLKGIALTLPDRLAKKAHQKRPLAIDLFLKPDPLLRVNLRYQSDLHIKLEIDKQRKKLHSADILWGEGSLFYPKQRGLTIKINQATFSPLAWLPLINTDTPKKKDKPTLLTRIEINTPALNWNNKNLGAFTFNLARDDINWKGRINSAFATGKIKFPITTDQANYQLDMETINLDELTKLALNDDTKPINKQGKLPLISIRSQQLIWRKQNLGKFSLSSQADQHGVFFDAINIWNDQDTLSLTGHWYKENGQLLSDFKGQLKSKKFGALLKKLDFSHEVKETVATLTFDFNWQAAPYQFSFADLNGGLKLELNEGRLSSIEPGFGRLLGVLAMEQWIKRLQLNFSDVYQEGLTFNTITGRYTVENGIAYSNELIVDAIPAKIILKGSINLGKQELDKEISVIPKSSAALPIAGTIVGSIATMIAQTITGEYTEGFYLRTNYHLYGKWNNLEVKPLHEQDGLLLKIGRGLTDFSWISD
ncbi:MAG: YhdP family protein [Methylococcales bacterium]|nr:YhdP family protein [Methylococcales bacterium]